VVILAPKRITKSGNGKSRMIKSRRKAFILFAKKYQSKKVVDMKRSGSDNAGCSPDSYFE